MIDWVDSVFTAFPGDNMKTFSSLRGMLLMDEISFRPYGKAEKTLEERYYDARLRAFWDEYCN